ncbi:hypothetical protein [Emticicia sp. 17c]|uniref:hypothetical protein n=1 Tax=Emticicia sp. 17c TaxID=3127704 RepID=UPI00301C8FAA
MDNYSQLSHTHFQYKLWRNEVEMIKQETDFFLTIINEIPDTDDTAYKTEKETFINQFHHFQRFATHVLEELDNAEKNLAESVVNHKTLDKEQKLDQKYLREEVDYFEQDYREVKSKFRNFVALSDALPVD